jgi:F-type H+-transporting ATPase subunit a
MEDIGVVKLFDLSTWAFVQASQRTPWTITSNDISILKTTLLVMVVLILLSWWVGRSAKLVPGGLQLFMEWIVGAMDDLCRESLGEELGRRFTPYICSTFLFILACNYSGLFGGVFGLHEPTANINTTLSLGLLGFAIACYQAMKFKGVFGFFRELVMEPIPVVMFPLNIVGEIAKVVSISFRLFGNIMGGAVIIKVVSWLIGYIVLPIGLLAFFGVFVGTVQAFVFAMLTLAYVSNGIELEEEEESA